MSDNEEQMKKAFKQLFGEMYLSESRTALQIFEYGYKAGAADEREKEWVGLTDEDIAQGAKQSWVDKQAFESVAWWAEEKLKEKNT